MKLLPFSGLLVFSFFCLSHAQSPEGDPGGQIPDSASSGEGVRAFHPLPFRAGDALEIVTYPDSGGIPAGVYSIDGDGFADFPIIGYVKVVDYTPESLAELLSGKYVDFMRYPYMSIRPLIRVALNGGFYRPGLYWIDPHVTLWETVQTAGGTQRRDGFEKLSWERDNAVVKENLVPLLQDGKSLYQIGFKTGDQLTVQQQPELTRWQAFRENIFPIMTFVLSTGISLITLYNTLELNRIYRDRL